MWPRPSSLCKVFSKSNFKKILQITKYSKIILKIKNTILYLQNKVFFARPALGMFEVFGRTSPTLGGHHWGRHFGPWKFRIK